MANPLRESSNQSARLTEASLPYIQQGADFMGGVPRGVQIAGGLQQQQIAARQLVMQESQHEAEMQDLALRGQLYQGELALRREQAMTRSAEAAAELQWRQTQNALSKMQQDESRVRIQRDVATLPPRKRKDGKWEVADYGDGGSVVWSTVEESDPRVQDYVNKQQDAAAEIDLKRSQAEANRAQAGWNDRRTSSDGTGRLIGGETVRGMLKDATESLDKLTSPYRLGGPASEKEIQDARDRVDFLRNSLDSMIERAGSAPAPKPTKTDASQNGSAPAADANAQPGYDGAENLWADKHRRDAMTPGERAVEDALADPDNLPIRGAIHYNATDLGFESPEQLTQALSRLVDAYINPLDQSEGHPTAAKLIARWLQAATHGSPQERKDAIETARLMLQGGK